MIEKRTMLKTESDRGNNPDVIQVIKTKVIVEIEKGNHVFTEVFAKVTDFCKNLTILLH